VAASLPTVSHAPARWWAIAAGGAVGTAARAGLLWARPAAEGGLPTTLLIENVVGAFGLGVLLGYLARVEGRTWWRSPFFSTGILGSFTTYSTLVAAVASMGDAQPWWAAGYAAVTVAGGLLAAALGWAWGRGRGGS
jgi:fluoride exporter